MAYDTHANFVVSTIVTPPSPASSGTSLVISIGDGAKFKTNANYTICPANTQPTQANSEIVRVTAIATDVLIIARTQEGTSARTIVVGDQIFLADTTKLFTDIENAIDTLATKTVTVDWEVMNLSFQSISWAQFAMFEYFANSTKRASPEPGTYPARVLGNEIDNGGDLTANRVFDFTSKTYTNITTVYTGSSTSVGSGFLGDTNSVWFNGQYVNYVLVDSLGATFAITGCTTSPRQLTFTGTPAAGAYSIRAGLPTTAVAFCSYLDSTNGGHGYVILSVSFNGGTNWQTFLDTSAATNLVGGSVTIVNSGPNFLFRASVVNDASGNGALIQEVLVCTDPSVWG